MPNQEGIGNPNELNNEQAAEWDMSDAPEMPTDDIPPEPADDIPPEPTDDTAPVMDVEGGQPSSVETDQPADGETEKNHEKELDPRVESLAIPLARDYAEKNYPKREDGTFEPAWRGRNGEKAFKNKSPEDLMAEGMSEEEAREAVIDIANQPYNEYSPYWQEQNRGGAEFLVHLMDERGADTLAGLDLSDEDVRAEYGALIHDNWIERNDWVKDPNWGDPVLSQPFADLPPSEQQKDIDQLAVLQEWMKNQAQ